MTLDETQVFARFCDRRRTILMLAILVMTTPTRMRRVLGERCRVLLVDSPGDAVQ